MTRIVLLSGCAGSLVWHLVSYFECVTRRQLRPVEATSAIIIKFHDLLIGDERLKVPEIASTVNITSHVASTVNSPSEWPPIISQH